MHVQLIAIPYDSGHRGRRMGAGPEHLLSRGLAERLRDAGHTVDLTIVEAPGEWHAEIRTTFEVTILAARAVADARHAGRFPLAGDHTQAYVHLDLDVIEPAVVQANLFAAPGGLTPSEVTRAIEAIGGSLGVGAAAITAYDPAMDASNVLADVASELAVTLVRAAGGGASR